MSDQLHAGQASASRSASVITSFERDAHIFAARNSQVVSIVAPRASWPGFAMFVVIGEFLLCSFIITGCIMLGGAHGRVAEVLFMVYVAFMLLNYFVVRWRHEILKKKVMKFKKMRKKVSSFDFGLPSPANTIVKTESNGAAPKKSK